jgi:cathepsin K
MKKNVYLLLLVLIVITGCAHLLEGDPIPVEVGKYNLISDTVKIVPDLGIDDPQTLGLEDGCFFNEAPENQKIEINAFLPIRFDLSKDMPPVKTQGKVGCCASFATTYYMKSYQEKIQHKYEYDNYGKVMSPSYVYNQVKVSEDCSKGSCLMNNLLILKRQGAATWQQFPFDGISCSLQPNNAQKELAKVNKIKAIYIVPLNDSSTVNYKRSMAIKSLLFKKIPVVIGMKIDDDFKEAKKNSDSVYIYSKFNSARPFGRHGMLIVGYDDRLNAFKVINSWGTSWGNKGYCYVKYDFFDLMTEDFEYLGEVYYTEDI